MAYSLEVLNGRVAIPNRIVVRLGDGIVILVGVSHSIRCCLIWIKSVGSRKGGRVSE